MVIASPPSLFDVAVVARTLYTGLGPTGWRLHVVGMGRQLPLKLLTEARIPVVVARSNLIFDTIPSAGRGRVYAVDPRGRRIKENMEPPSMLLVDYSGALRSALDAEPVSALGTPMLAYEAAVLIYALYVKPRFRSIIEGKRAYSSDIRSGVYLARKVLEAIRVFDNYVLLEPSVIVHTLKRVLLARGMLLDPAEYIIEIDPIDGATRQRIEMKVYDKRLRERGHARAVFEDNTLTIECCNSVLFRIEVDAEHRRACSAPGLCVSSNNIHGDTLWPTL